MIIKNKIKKMMRNENIDMDPTFVCILVQYVQSIQIYVPKKKKKAPTNIEVDRCPTSQKKKLIDAQPLLWE